MELRDEIPISYACRGNPYVVLKFGGTSVASRQGWDVALELVRRHWQSGRRVVLVCSAAAGVTDRLTRLIESLAAGGDPAPMLADIARLHRRLGAALEVDAGSLLAGDERDLAAAARAEGALSPARRAAILAHGELMSTRLGTAFLAARGLPVARIDARRLLRAADGGGPREEETLSARCAPLPTGELRAALEATGAEVFVTQGFIAGGPSGETVLLGRGGSDASGAYLAAGLAAEALEIWTDVPGIFTADPRACPEARLVRRLSYGEAEAIGALGAKVLHPRTIEPVRHAGIPIRIGWTGRPEVEGTRIARARPARGAKAIVSRRNLALITMWRPSSWQPVGFMAEVAGRFHRLGLSMDLIASSPSEIRVTIDLAAFPSAAGDLERLCAELEDVCRPRVVPRVACVSAVGAGLAEDLSARWRGFAGISEGAVHMVCHAANGQHVSVVVAEEAEPDLVAAAHRELLAGADDDSTFGPDWSTLHQGDPAPARRSAKSQAEPAKAPSQEACA
jgi:diaminopimelate decarboxylase/aspartate kinase